LLRTLITRVLPLCFIGGAIARAQTGSSGISGTILDAAGAMVPNASIEIDSIDTGTKRSTISSASGVYSLTGLAVGRYSVHVQLPGFQTFALDNVQLQVGQNLTLDAHLQLASAATSVDVTGTALPLDEVSAAVGGVVSEDRMPDSMMPRSGSSTSQMAAEARSSPIPISASSPPMRAGNSTAFGWNPPTSNPWRSTAGRTCST
jgi:hypothetical protein